MLPVETEPEGCVGRGAKKVVGSCVCRARNEGTPKGVELGAYGDHWVTINPFPLSAKSWYSIPFHKIASLKSAARTSTGSTQHTHA